MCGTSGVSEGAARVPASARAAWARVRLTRSPSPCCGRASAASSGRAAPSETTARQGLAGVLGPGGAVGDDRPEALIGRGRFEQDLAAHRDAVARDPIDAGAR